MQVIHELRSGVRLKKTDYTRTPIEYELTPYEILMDDIRSKRYKLNKVRIVISIISMMSFIKTLTASIIHYIVQQWSYYYQKWNSLEFLHAMIYQCSIFDQIDMTQDIVYHALGIFEWSSTINMNIELVATDQSGALKVTPRISLFILSWLWCKLA